MLKDIVEAHASGGVECLMEGSGVYAGEDDGETIEMGTMQE